MVPSINATTQQKSPDSSPQSRSHPELNGEGKLPYNLPSSVTSQHVQFLFRKQAQDQLKAYDFELSKLDRNAQRAMELCDLSAADKYLSHAIMVSNTRERLAQETGWIKSMDTAQLITADSVIIKRRQVHFNNLLALGLASLEIGEHRAAVKYLQQCYQLMQKAGEVMQQQQQAQKEQRTTAIAVLKQSLIVKYPPMQTIHLYLCLAYCGNGNYQEALLHINHCIALSPMEGDYQIIRLKIFISTQQYQIACELIRRWDAVPKVHPELEVVMKRLQEQAIRLHREALDRLASDQHRGALELLDEAVSISPSSLAIRRDRSRVLRHLEMYQRSLDDMLWIYETEKQNEGARAARTFEDRDLLLEIASLWESLGHSLMKSAAEEVDKRAERQEEALACFRRALGSQPDNADYIKNVAVYYDTIGKFEDSVEYYEQYVAKRPDDKQTVQRMCEILIRLGNQTANHDERGIRLAFRRYDRVLDLQPDNLEARFARLRLNMRSQNWVAAKQDVGVILRIYPDDSDALRMFEEIKCRDN